MLIIIGLDPNLYINHEAIKDVYRYGGATAEQYFKRINCDYELFKRVYNRDLTLTLNELITFAKSFGILLKDLLVLC